MAGIVSSTLVPRLSKALPSSPDVVVIGAGAAGLSAAMRLIAAGKSPLVLEAGDRIGGRAYTTNDIFGLPYDVGCAWLQGPANLPHYALARELGFTLVDYESASEAVFAEGRLATAAERNAYWRSWDRIETALEKADGRDVAASSVIPANAPFTGSVQAWMGALDYGVEFSDLSTGDYNSYADLEIDYLVHEGMGTLVAHLGRDVPVQLGTPATAVDWSGEGVRVETPVGAIEAPCCIVTVSTGVLASGSLRFTPELPAAKQEAIADVPMGLIERIGLQFDGARFGLPESGVLTRLTDEPPPAPICQFVTFPTGHEVVVGFVGGSFGWELAGHGAEAAIDFALAEFVRSVGSDARRHFIKGHFSNWAGNPLTNGAYSAARPGRHSARAVLAEPVAERVFFAGEAVADDHVALMAGAHMSGERVAEQVIARLETSAGCSGCDARKRSLRRIGEGATE